MAEKKTTITEVTAEVIQRRAFALYEERGCQDGADVDDWLKAERQLLVEAAANTTARQERELVAAPQ